MSREKIIKLITQQHSFTQEMCSRQKDREGQMRTYRKKDTER